MSRLGYYPGCSLGGTAREYDRSLRAVAPKLGYELAEVPEWVCCGASSAHAIDHAAAMALAGDTLAKAHAAGLDQVLAPCAMCYSRLASVGYEMRQHPETAKDVASALGSGDGLEKVKAISLLQWLDGVSEEAIKGCVTRPLTGLKVACYYGCLLVRPPKMTEIANVEVPTSMERVLKILGATPVRWSQPLECCGGSFAVSRKSVVLRQGRRIYDAAQEAGADVICLACPMCHSNLDVRQAEFLDAGQKPIPVVYLTQLLGVAMGMSNEEMEFKGHFVEVESALAKK